MAQAGEEQESFIRAGDYVILRTHPLGVYAGTLLSRAGQDAELADARQLWFWAGAATLSQLTEGGSSSPEKCKFLAQVPRLSLHHVIEILTASDAARKSIDAVPFWCGSLYRYADWEPTMAFSDGPTGDTYGYAANAGRGSGDGSGSGDLFGGGVGCGLGYGSAGIDGNGGAIGARDAVGGGDGSGSWDCTFSTGCSMYEDGTGDG